MGENFRKGLDNGYYGRTTDNDIAKHSFNIIDLIEVGDILELKENTDDDIVFIGLTKETIPFNYKDILEKVEKGELTLVSVLTKEQHKANRYEV